ncbi:MAG: dihydrofolate reductase [Candidatus Nanoarchaeia archaeon]
MAAVSENNVIGNQGKIPWRIKEDVARFKELTVYPPVIMGRLTYESIPPKFRPLSERKNIVISLTMQASEGMYVARTIEEAIALSEGRDTYVAGGQRVYQDFLPHADRIELTQIYRSFEGDAFFPQIEMERWKPTAVSEVARTQDGLEYQFFSYERTENNP